MFLFRYQRGGFYARQLSDADPSSPYFDIPKDTSCGYYETNSVPFPVPKEIVLTQKVPGPDKPEWSEPEEDGVDVTVVHLLVREIELGSRSSPLPREMFSPDPTLLASNTIHVIVTNGVNYSVRGNSWKRMDLSEEEAMRELQEGRKRRKAAS